MSAGRGLTMEDPVSMSVVLVIGEERRWRDGDVMSEKKEMDII